MALSSISGDSSPEPGVSARVPVEKDYCISGLLQDFLFLSNYLAGLSDQEWSNFNAIMVNPVTKVEFFTLLTTLVKHVDLTSVQLLIPALLKMIREHSEHSFVHPATSQPPQTEEKGIKLFNNGTLIKIIPNKGSSRASTASMCSAPPKIPSTTNVEDEEAIKFFNNGGLVKIIPKGGSSRASTASMSSARPKTPSTTNVEDEEGIKFFNNGVLVKIIPKGGSSRASTASRKLTDSQKGSQSPTLHRLGLTDEDLKCSVQNVLKEMQVIGSISDGFTDQLIDAIVKEIGLTLKAGLAEVRAAITTSQKNTTALQKKACTEQLVQNISFKLSDFLGAQDQVNAEVSQIDLTSASAVGRAMVTVVQSMEHRLNDREYNSPVKTCLAGMRRAVKALTCQYASGTVPSQQEHTESDGNNKGMRCDSQVSGLSMKTVSSEAFRTKAQKAVRDVLTGKFNERHSALETPSSDSIEAESDLFSLCPQPVEEAATVLIEMFLKEMKKIVQSADSTDEPTSPCEGKSVIQAQHRVSSRVSGLNNTKAQRAAKKMYKKIRSTLREFFRHLSLQESVRSDQVLPVARPVIPVPHKEQDPHKVQSVSECPLTSQQLDTCTKQVLKVVLDSYFSGWEQKEQLTAGNSCFFNSVTAQLTEMAGSASVPGIEDSYLSLSKDTGRLRKSCLNRLSSVQFQINACDAVTDVLIASVHSYTSLRLCAPENVDECREPWDSVACQDMDALVTEIVDQFVSDVQDCTREHLPAPRSAHSSKLNMAASTTKLGISDNKSIDTASNMYQNLLSKIGTFFAQCSNWCDAPRKASDGKHKTGTASVEALDATQITDDALLADQKDVGDLDSCAREVMSTLLMVLEERSTKEEAIISMKGSPPFSVTEMDMAMDSVSLNMADEKDFDSCVPKDFSDSMASLTQLIEEVFGAEGNPSNAVQSESELLLQSITDDLSRPFNSPATAKMVAREVVEAIVDGVWSNLRSSPSSNAVDPTCPEMPEGCEKTLPRQANDQMGSHLYNNIWTTTSRMFRSLRQKVKNVFLKDQALSMLCSKTSGGPYVCAKKAISKALIDIQRTLVKSEYDQNLDDLQIIHDVINSMLANIGDETMVESTEGTTEKRTSGHMTNGQVCCITRQAVGSVVQMVTSRIASEDGGCSLPAMEEGGLCTVAKKLTRSLSQVTVRSSTQDLIDQISGVFMNGNKLATARRSVSDSVLLELGRGSASKRHMMLSKLVKLYAEEAVKHYLLPHFNLPPTLGFFNQGGSSQPVSSPVSSPSSSSRPALARPAEPTGLRSPPKILSDILSLVIKTMVSDVMNSLPLALESGNNNVEDQVDSRSLKPSIEDLLSTQTSGASSQEPGFHSDWPKDAIPFSFPAILPVDANNYAGLVTLLVARLLTQIDSKGLQSDDVLEKSCQLVEKVLCIFEVMSGCSRNDPFPLSTRIHRAYRTVYCKLLEKFGSKKSLQRAMDSEDPSFEETLVSSLTKELLKMSKEAGNAKPTSSNKDAKEAKTDSCEFGKTKGNRKGILRFLPKIPKFKIFQKKSKSVSMEDQLTSEKHYTECPTSAVLPGESPTTSEQRSGGRHANRGPSLFRKLSAMMRRKSRVSPE